MLTWIIVVIYKKSIDNFKILVYDVEKLGIIPDF